ncbi:hypothetical protein Val02_59920 [Virgisporangium aliadipatigenens]|uniref:Uncharacterized protein n=1 Tax=Virgisporangium aliadipatigenens TaxID=741659 RepID=A0A8J4DTC4_9ACTN|nr:hypothetical protein [Virgisporangium aliadipatigenens]GIJ49106.1 hypothetical protein Val02_59920 [Virgisporangium aliadipatigenens]
MFRLIQLRPDGWTPTVYFERDGYTAEESAWAGYALASDDFFGVGRFDQQGILAEVIVDPVCSVANGPEGEHCQLPVAAAAGHDDLYRPRCAGCAEGLPEITLTELGLELGVPVRTAGTSARHGRRVRMRLVRILTGRIRTELAGHVADPGWRRSICAALLKEPLAADGLVEAVGALGDKQVLDLFPALCQLTGELPVPVLRRLREGMADPASPAAVAAFRLGVTG